MDWTHPEIRELVRRALAEDVGPGDITTEACVAAEARGEGVFLARQELVLAGVELLEEIYNALGGVERVYLLAHSGDEIAYNQPVARVAGPARTLLTAERTALNFVQRLSGIATLARRFVRAVEGTTCRVLDTRKTTPGVRRLEKLAVAAGGAANHRMGLYDAILIKNNHITAAGGVRAALERARSVAPAWARVPAGGAGRGAEAVAAGSTAVEIEVRSRAELEEALACGAAHVLLDNFSPAEVAEAVRLIAGRARVEVSGGVTLQNVRAYAETGADFVSSGAITHSAPAADLSFRLV